MTPFDQKIVPVILSGGSGSRLWPMSRDTYPKQFLALTDGQMPMIQDTLRRVSDNHAFHPPLMVGNNAHRFLLAEQMRKSGIERPEILIEPDMRNTAPAITAAALRVQQHYGNALILAMPTDHVIENVPAFLESVERAKSAALKGYIVTFGITPSHPETGYGYIRRGHPLAGNTGAFQIASFVEKPNEKTAAEFFASGEYFWNSGIFLFSAALLLEEMERLQPALVHACQKALFNSTKDLDFIRLNDEAFRSAESISIDYGLMEHTDRSAMVPLDCGWSDTGAWDLLWKLAAKDGNGNASFGECYVEDSRNCYVRNADGPAIATLGVDNLVIISTKDAVMVTTRERSQSLKGLVTHVKQQNPKLVQDHYHVFRPWGSYESIKEGAHFQVKRLTVKPGEKLSLQMHNHRAEHWIVVSGSGLVTCDGVVKTLAENESCYVPRGSVHSIENPGTVDLNIIEVQTGSYLGEDDIVRFEDRYGRVCKIKVG